MNNRGLCYQSRPSGLLTLVGKLLCCAALLPLLGVAPAWAQNPKMPARPVVLPASYVELYREILASYPAKEPHGLHEAVSLGEAAARLWLRTGDAAYRKQAVQHFEAVLSSPQFDLKDFHVLQSFGRLVLLLQQEKLIRPEQDKKLREVASKQLKAFCQSQDNGDYNIRLAQVLGYACLLKYLDGQPYAERDAARKRLSDYWSLIRQTGDLDEDASNYDSLGCAFMIDLAQVLGREEDLQKSAGFRRLFERFRDIVSPSGLIPEYGDAYFSYVGCPLDRIYILEYAAHLYDDPTFLYAARKLYRRPQAALPSMDSWYRALPLISLEVSTAAPKTPQGDASVVTYRRRRGRDRPLVDKLILRGGLEPGASMIMMDLYASGSHAHPEKGPSVAYYEVDEVPLFHNMGRHRTRSAITGNLFWAMPATERFPGCWNQDNTWFTMTLPVDYLTQEGDRYAIAPVMTLRNFQEHNRQCRYLFFDNLRLEGPSGVRIVDDFEDKTRWEPKVLKLTEVINSDDRTQGRFSERVFWKPLPSGTLNRKLTERPKNTFGKDEYRQLKLDLKYVGARPYMHIRGLGKQVDLGDQLLISEVGSARAEQRGKDAYGQVHYTSYVSPDSSLTRHLVLTAEGYLVVHDVLVPGRSMAGWNAGPLWQLYEVKAKGKDWFCSDDDGPYPAGDGAQASTKRRRMLVRFAVGPNTQAGIEEVKQGYYCPNPKGRRAEHFFTTFSQRQVTPGRKECFTLAVVPHPPDEADPATVARGVTARTGPGNAATVSIRAADGKQIVEVKIDEAGWEVRRPH